MHNHLSHCVMAALLAGVLSGCGNDASEAEAPPAPEPVVTENRPEPRPPDPEPEIEPEPEPDPEPVVEPEPKVPYGSGDWIGPINGVRFGMRMLDPDANSVRIREEPIRLLLFAENITDREIDWVPFYAEPSVRRPEGVPDWVPAWDPSANLRVWLLPTEGRGPGESFQSVGVEGYPNTGPGVVRLAPGQRHVTALLIFPGRIDNDYEDPDGFDAELRMVWYDPTWPPQTHHVRVRYQAGGFEPPPGRPDERSALWGWQDVWVQFEDLEVLMW